MKNYVLNIIKIWLLICCVFIFCSQTTHLFGREVYIKTTPIDPRDLMRGNYVRLNFEISQFKDIENTIRYSPHYGERVYVLLNLDENNFVHYFGFTKEKPKKGLFLSAQIRKQNENSYDYSATYGIESYFLTPKKARQLEFDLRTGGIAKVKIDKFGKAKVTGFLKQ